MPREWVLKEPRDEGQMGMSFACYHGTEAGSILGHACDGYTLFSPQGQLYRKCKCLCHVPYKDRELVEVDDAG